MRFAFLPMTQSTPKKTKIVPIRTTPEEYAAWEQAAAGMPVSAFVRMCVASFLARGSFRPRRALTEQDRQSLARVQAMLGQSRIPNNLNQIAKAIHNDTIVVTPETESLIRRACEAVLTIRDILVRLMPKAGRS